MKNIFQDLKRKDHKRYLGGLDVFKYIGVKEIGYNQPADIHYKTENPFS